MSGGPEFWGVALFPGRVRYAMRIPLSSLCRSAPRARLLGLVPCRFALGEWRGVAISMPWAAAIGPSNLRLFERLLVAVTSKKGRLARQSHTWAAMNTTKLIIALHKIQRFNDVKGLI